MILRNQLFQKVLAVFSFIMAFIFLILTVSQIQYFTKSEPIQPVNEVRPPPPKDNFFRGMPNESPFMFTVFLFGFIVNCLSGIVLYHNLDRKEKKEIKSKLISDLLLPDEKLIIKLLEENNGQMVQSELVNRSNLNKLKVSRVIKRLESSKIVTKHPYGATNKIILKMNEH